MITHDESMVALWLIRYTILDTRNCCVSSAAACIPGRPTNQDFGENNIILCFPLDAVYTTNIAKVQKKSPATSGESTPTNHLPSFPSSRAHSEPI